MFLDLLWLTTLITACQLLLLLFSVDITKEIFLYLCAPQPTQKNVCNFVVEKPCKGLIFERRQLKKGKIKKLLAKLDMVIHFVTQNT